MGTYSFSENMLFFFLENKLFYIFILNMLKVKSDTNFKHTESQARYKMSDKETRCSTKFQHCQTFCLVHLKKFYRPLAIAYKSLIISFFKDGKF